MSTVSSYTASLKEESDSQSLILYLSLAAQQGAGKYQSAGVMLGGYGSKPVAWNGHHDPATGGICPAFPHRPIRGVGFIWPVLVAESLHGNPICFSLAPQ